MHSQLLPPLDEIFHIDLSERVDLISALPYALDPGIDIIKLSCSLEVWITRSTE
jgi:hypothetical protein